MSWRITQEDLTRIDAWFRKKRTSWHERPKFSPNCLLSAHLACSPYKQARNRAWMLNVLNCMKDVKHEQEWAERRRLMLTNYPRPV